MTDSAPVLTFSLTIIYQTVTTKVRIRISDILYRMLNEGFIFVGIAINAIGTIYYLKDTIKGKIKPNKVTFLMWFIAALVAFFAQVTQGVGIQSLVTLSFGLFPFSIFINPPQDNTASSKCGEKIIFSIILYPILF